MKCYKCLNHLIKLSPAYFGLVMATGIISLSATMMGLVLLAQALFFLNTIQYAVLWALYILRAIYYPRQCLDDLQDHAQAPGYLTIVAATGILTNQFLLEYTNLGVGVILWAITFLLWLVLSYLILFLLITKKDRKPRFELSLNGSWLLLVVACQSVAISSGLLASKFDAAFSVALGLLALSLWLLGGLFYVWISLLIVYRWLFFPLAAQQLSPTYWITMGAMAISTLAGTVLITNAAHMPMVLIMLPYIQGLSVCYWVVSSWWIPLLVCLEIWRYRQQRQQLIYEPAYWALVFPLGMYSASSWQIGNIFKLGFFAILAHVFLYIAMLTWVLVYFGMLSTLIKTLRQSKAT